MDCPICFDVKALVTISPCKHKFCTSCIENWLNQQKITSCPKCRRAVGYTETVESLETIMARPNHPTHFIVRKVLPFLPILNDNEMNNLNSNDLRDYIINYRAQNPITADLTEQALNFILRGYDILNNRQNQILNLINQNIVSDDDDDDDDTHESEIDELYESDDDDESDDSSDV